jgi:hypothetical protein
MRQKAKRIVAVPMLAVALLAAGTGGEAIAAKAGPVTAKCGKFKQKAAKQGCLKQNQANRIAFNQIKNSRFVGTRGDGQAVDSVYCANGKFESRISDSYGTGVSTGRSWKIDEATVRQGGKWINAILRGQDGFEIGLQRRGVEWKYGISRSFGEIENAGAVEKTNAADECATLEV